MATAPAKTAPTYIVRAVNEASMLPISSVNPSLTWLGTNSWLLQAGEDALLVDPFVEMSGAENPNGLEKFIAVAGEYDVRDVLISHCHFDHLSSIPAFLREHPALVYCTECGVPALQQDGCDCKSVIIVAPGNEFEIGAIKVRVYAGRHIKFDIPLVLKTINPRNMARATQNNRQIFKWLLQYKEAGETVVYDVELPGGKRIQFLGSCSLHEGARYKTGADYLILPYQGNSHIDRIATEVIAKLKPKCVIASHFDDAFPPISETADLAPLERMMVAQFPEVPLIIPQVDRPIPL